MACMQISNGYEVLTYHRRRFPSRDLAASDLTPCFLWIFLGGPYIEKLRGNEALTTTLSAVTAAVVGVVLNLAVWFGLHVIIPGDGTLDLFAILVGTVAFIGMVRWRWDIVPVVLSAG